MRRLRFLGLAVMLAASLAFLCASGSLAQERVEPVGQGPFTERNQFPFNLLFFSFPFRSGFLLPPHTFEIEVVTAYANTFAQSDVFTSLATNERVRLTPDAVEAARFLEPGDDLFFMDTEQDRTAFSARFGTARRIEVDIEIPVLSYRGGMFDPAIEGYHRTFGLANGGRDLYEQNIVQMALTIGNDQYFSDRSPSTLQLGDISLTARFALRESGRGALAASVALKLPTGDAETLGGSGSLDAGADLEGTLVWERQQLHLSGGWVHVGSWTLFPKFNPSDIWSAGAAYEYVRSDRLSWIGQLQTQASVFRGHAAADGALAKLSTEMLVGARWSGAQDRWRFQTALIENVFEQNNGVDVGILAGFTVRFRGDGPAKSATSPAP